MYDEFDMCLINLGNRTVRIAREAAPIGRPI